MLAVADKNKLHIFYYLDISISKGATCNIAGDGPSNSEAISSSSLTVVADSNLWTTMLKRIIIEGDGNCFFSAVNCCMSAFDRNCSHDHVSLRNLSLTKLERMVYDDPEFYIHHISHSMESLDQISLWKIIKAKYQCSGQYADHDILMATVAVLELDIQLHGSSDVLLRIENRIPGHIIHLLYCGVQIDSNRGNHFDALLPLNSCKK